MKAILTILCLLSASCVQLKYSAQTPKGTETFALNSFGGGGVLDSAGGTRFTHNHNKSAGQFFQTVATVAGSVAGAYAKNSDNVAATAAGQQSTVQAVAAGKEATAQKAIEAGVTTEAIKAGVTTIPK